MSLFTESSLCLVPSAVKDGKVYSIKPTDGSGDLTFSRGSDIEATRVASNGYIEKAKVNLFLQSNSFSTTWVSSGLSETSGQSGYDGSSDAWLIENVAGGSRFLTQTFTAGLYTASVYAKAGTVNFVALNNGAGAIAYFDLSTGTIGTNTGTIDAKIQSIGSGWYRISMAMASASEMRVYPTTADGSLTSAIGSTIYIQDAQLNYGLVAQEYQETTTTSVVSGITNDMPRLDYSGGASCPSLLLEPSRTNSMLYSEYIGAYFFYSNASATNNATTSPEGVVNAASIIPDATSGLHQIASSNISASGSFTLSAFVKAGELNKVAIRESNATGAYASFDLSTGTKIEDNVSGAAFIEAYSNGWYRIGVTYTNTGNIRLGINVLSNSYTTGNPSSGATYWSSNGTDKLYVYGLQCELGATYATSYIPTYGTSATRTGDDLTKVFSPAISQNGGTFFIELKGTPAGTGSSTPFLTFSHSNPSSYVGFGATTSWRCRINDNGTARLVSSPVQHTEDVKLCIRYGDFGYEYYANGASFSTYGTAIDLGDLQSVAFVDGTEFYGNIEIKQILTFPFAISDAEAIALTSL